MAFFATSHEKSPFDGVGGTLKRLATRASLQRLNESQIQTAKELYEWAVIQNFNMSFVFCASIEIKKQKKNLTKRFKDAKPVTGTRQFHAFISENSHLKVKIFSSSESNEIRQP